MRENWGKLFLVIPFLFSFGLSAGEIKGVVRDTETNAPLGGAVVNVRSSALAEKDGLNALTEDDGSFGFKDLPAGTYKITVDWSGATSEDTLEITEGGISNVALKVAISKAKVETYTVTGTRIKSPNQTAVSPVTSVGEQILNSSGSTSIETVLNTLPQTFSDQGQTYSNGSDGTARINLRGFGSGRGLVLFDGRRLGPGGAGAFVDLNFIPSALIERVDLLTGGSSAVYGADAVTGVVNFIPKKKFEGVQLDVSGSAYQHIQHNDRVQSILEAKQKVSALPEGYSVPPNVFKFMGPAASLIIGANTSNGKGNATAYGTYRLDYELLQNDYDHSKCALNSGDPVNGLSGADGNPIADFTCGGSTTSFPTRVIATGADGKAKNFAVTGYDFKPFNDATDTYNFAPLNYFQRPDERFTLGGLANYEIMPWAKVYTQLMYLNDTSPAQIAPDGTFQGLVRTNCDNPLLSDAQKTKLGCDLTKPLAGQNLTLRPRRRNVEGGPRNFRQEHQSFRNLLGMSGDLDKNWNYDLYHSFMSTTEFFDFRQFIVPDKYNKAMNAVKDADGKIVCKSFLDGSDTSCVPYNIFDQNNPPTKEALAYLSSSRVSGSTTTQRIVDLSLTGDLTNYGVKSPWARNGVALSVGGQYRKEAIKTWIDGADADRGDKAFDESFRVWEGFSELRLPILEGLPGIKTLAAEGAYRYSDYDFGKKTHTFKAGGEWEFLENMRVRGSYQRAVRAPSLNQLFGQQFLGLGGTTDPCAGLAAGKDDEVIGKCMRAFKITREEVLNILVNTAAQYTTKEGGNPKLAPEEADTLSFGFVAQPSFVPGLTVSADYFRINLGEAIGSPGADYALQKCVDTIDDPNRDPKWCDAVHRDPETQSLWLEADLQKGTGFTDSLPTNLSQLNTSGIDFIVDYDFDLKDVGVEGWGKLAFNWASTWLATLATQTLPDSEKYDCVGFYGPSKCGTPNNEWRHRVQLSWLTPINLNLITTFRFRSGVQLESLSTQTELNNPDEVFATDSTISARANLDVQVNYTPSDMFTFRFGVNNVLDSDAPVIGQGSCGGTGACNGNGFPSTYDSLGRYIYLNGTVKF